MHNSSYKTMKDFLSNFDKNKNLKILDVGSLSINTTLCYRSLMSENWEYTGIDIVEGPNVDIVTKDPYKYLLNNEIFDIVISGQCMEHVLLIQDWMKELYRVLKPGGSICIIAPSTGKQHTNIDCWRIMPHGMNLLMEWVGFKVRDVHLVGNPKWNDCVGIGEK